MPEIAFRDLRQCFLRLQPIPIFDSTRLSRIKSPKSGLLNSVAEYRRTTIANILKKHGIDPAQERRKRTTWSQFLRAHWSVLAAAAFFTVEVG